MKTHIDYDREVNKIELILDSQSNVISTLVLSRDKSKTSPFFAIL